MELVSKISSKMLVGEVKLAQDGFLFDLVGNANGLKTGTTQFGEYTGLTGEFIARCADGKVFSSGVAFPPQVAIDLIAGRLGESPVQFGFRVSKKTDKTSPCGYRYTVENLFEPKENPLMELMGTIEAPKALKEGKAK